MELVVTSIDMLNIISIFHLNDSRAGGNTGDIDEDNDDDDMENPSASRCRCLSRASFACFLIRGPHRGGGSSLSSIPIAISSNHSNGISDPKASKSL